jgi:NAD(P)-dependent dehydrogenase (short-subunit alcohol dehydrogenase family)
MAGPLTGKVALVAGATRGAGRAIVVELARAGATVYATGRSTRSAPSEYNRPETIEETGELMEAAGGTGVALRVDHLDPGQVAALVRRIDADHGRLDVLVNDIWGGEKLFQWDARLWEHDLDKGLRLLRLAVDTHLVTSHHALPLLIRRPGGLVVEMTDGTADYNARNYRVNAFYDLAKSAVLRLAWSQGHELAGFGYTAVALTPGRMRSEMMLEVYGVTEANWRDVPGHFGISETPTFTAGRWSRSPPTPTSPAGTRPPCPRGSWPGSTGSSTSTAAPRTPGATWSRSRTPASHPTPPPTAEEGTWVPTMRERSWPATTGRC